MIDFSPTYLIPAIFLLVTQLIKYADPVWFEKVSRWVGLSLVGLGAALNVLWALSEETFVGVDNTATLILMVLFVVLEGAILGASAVGIYTVGKEADVPGFETSSELVAKG